MKYLFLILFCPFISNAQIIDTSGIHWIQTECDFGVVNYNSPATTTFKFVNKSNTPTEIISVEASCGCTQPTWTENLIMPGDTAFVKATFNAKTVGPFRKQVTIYTTRSSFPTQLILKGEVIKQ